MYKKRIDSDKLVLQFTKDLEEDAKKLQESYEEITSDPLISVDQMPKLTDTLQNDGTGIRLTMGMVTVASAINNLAEAVREGKSNAN